MAISVATLYAIAEDKEYVTGGASVEFASRQISYGLADNREPILTPAASLSFFDLLSFEAAFIMDTTDWGRRKHRGSPGYGDRAWRYQELDAGVGLAHNFSEDDFEWLPTCVQVEFGYMYEYHPRFSKKKSSGVNGNPDTQFATAAISLPDLLLVPKLSYERDFMRDNGTYVNFELSHSIDLIEEELALTIALAQGWGDASRNNGYLDEYHAGLMDSSFNISLEWKPYEHVVITPFAGIYEYLFDRRLRDAARWYSYGGEHKTESFNVVGGLTVAVEF